MSAEPILSWMARYASWRLRLDLAVLVRSTIRHGWEAWRDDPPGELFRMSRNVRLHWDFPLEGVRYRYRSLLAWLKQNNFLVLYTSL